MTKPLPYIEGYFPFTTPQNHEKDLDGWKKHFEVKGIKTLVREHRERWILYREGRDACKDTVGHRVKK